jgi:hypothetical protein
MTSTGELFHLFIFDLRKLVALAGLPISQSDPLDPTDAEHRLSEHQQPKRRDPNPCRRQHNPLLRSGAADRQGVELGPDRTRKRLVHDPTALRSARVVV